MSLELIESKNAKGIFCYNFKKNNNLGRETLKFFPNLNYIS